MNIQSRDITIAVFKQNSVFFDDLAFLAFWDLGYTVIAIKDEHMSIADLCGDTYCPIANPDISTNQLLKEKRAYVRKIKSEGVWGCGIAKNGQPLYETFVWGFVGDDFIGSGYDAEIVSILNARPIVGDR